MAAMMLSITPTSWVTSPSRSLKIPSSRAVGAARRSTRLAAGCRAVLSVRADMKDSMLSQLSGQTTPTSEDRLLVSELLTKVEASSPEETPAYSPMLDGTWEVIYSGGISPGPIPSPTREIALLMYAGGFTPASFFLSMGSKLPESLLHLNKPSLTITPAQPRATAAVTATAFGQKQEIMLRSDLEIQSATRLRETYNEAEIAGRVLSLPDVLKWERDLFITYLDATTLVVRDETGSPDIFVRKSAIPPNEVFEEDLVPEQIVIEDDNFIDMPTPDMKTTEYEM